MHHDTTAALFTAANLAIVGGYLAVPALVLPYLPLTWAARLAGAGFFLGCAATHAWMALGHQHAGTWWTAEHILQAGCTWAFILIFRRDLQRAHALRADLRKRQRAVP